MLRVLERNEQLARNKKSVSSGLRFFLLYSPVLALGLLTFILNGTEAVLGASFHGIFFFFSLDIFFLGFVDGI